ncbi:MAG: DUF5320 domain-containing protein [Ruminococcaceae bacterium]|nr:DUF5320 domain-containing protein [Oscillospiraceae bacterium]
MPRRDGTGPMSEGKMTGRKLGQCEGSNTAEFTEFEQEFGSGQGCRRNSGFGRRCDSRRGCRRGSGRAFRCNSGREHRNGLRRG